MKVFLISFMTLAMCALAGPVLATQVEYAQIDKKIKATCTGDQCKGSAENKVNTLVEDVINIFSWIVGVVSVIMVIFGGFRYITSGGDAGKVTSAKNTIVYALVGLVVAALAQVLVLFVLGKVT